MTRLHGLNNHRGEIYQQQVLAKARAKADAEKEKEKSEATEQTKSKVDGATATPDAASKEVMHLDVIKSGNVAIKQDDSNSKSEQAIENLMSTKD